MKSLHLTLLALFTMSSLAIAQSHTYPPISRDTEYFEKSLKRDEEKIREEQRRLLQAARDASEEILNKSQGLKIWSNSYSIGNLEKRQFQRLLKSLTDEIQDLTGDIERISTIDPSFKDKPAEYEKASSLEGVNQLIGELETCAESLKKRVFSLTGGTNTDVNDLQAQSLDALTENVKRISKAISKSTKSIR
jgi:hypothetical protein